jgi:RNA polymerase sigma-70 factor, ECF subfamily
LPRQFREAVYYADVEGLRYNEIAALMKTPRGTVMLRLHRGRRQLCTLLSAAVDPVDPDAASAPLGPVTQIPRARMSNSAASR